MNYAAVFHWCVTVMIYLAPVHFPGGLMGPTKSMAHLSNSCSVTCGFKGISSLRDGFLVLWQTSQFLQNSFASLWTIGHHSPTVKTFCAISLPATPTCASSRILLRSCSKTYMHSISSGPNLYNYPAISVKSAACTTSCFFCCVMYDSGFVLVVKK